MKDQYMSVNDVCDLLNLKKNFVYKLVNEGKLPHLRFEKLIRIRRSELEYMSGTTSAPDSIYESSEKYAPKPAPVSN